MDSSGLGDYAVFGALLLAGFAFVAAAMTANRLLRPSAPSRAKGTAYECGVDPVGGDWAQVRIRYYVYAFLFVLFAVEAVFLFPWAVSLGNIGIFGFWSMICFLGILTIGFIYEWKKGALEWE